MISEQQAPLKSGFGAKSEPSEVLDGIDLSGKTAIVTGGYSGIGLETTRALSGVGARVIVPARRISTAKAQLAGIIEDVDIFEMDLADLKSVDRFVRKFLESDADLDILINNAAVMACPQMLTKEGWDLQFAVNHIGHFMLTKGLLPKLPDPIRRGLSRYRLQAISFLASGGRMFTLRNLTINGSPMGNPKLPQAFSQWSSTRECEVMESKLSLPILVVFLLHFNGTWKKRK